MMRMVCIRYMRMHMSSRVVTMPVAVRTGRHAFMHMIVVPVVMAVRVLMLDRFVLVLVSVRFGKVEHHAGEHQDATRPQ